MKTQKVRNLAIVAVAAMLLATTAISMSTTTQSALATYNKNQATSQANACGNDFFPINVGCQNTGSQIQGDENAVALTAQQTFPAAEVTPPFPPGSDCHDCLRLLSDTQLQALAVEITDQFGILFPKNATPEQIIEIICDALELGPPDGLTVGNVNAAMAQVDSISNILRQTVRACLNAIF